MHSLSIKDLSFFSDLVKDYLHENIKTERLYSFKPSLQGLKDALVSKEENYSHRELLKVIIDKNYNENYIPSDEEKNSLDLLKDNGYAITTAHQPNLFLGPLYTITKAVSTISLANKINSELKVRKVVPIFVIGSEDHDKEELLHTYLFGKKYEWLTQQKGAVGSMKIDESFLRLLNEWISAFGNFPYANELKEIYTSSYILNNSVAYSTGLILKKIFGKYGLIVLDLNHKEVKEAMVPIFEKELKENFASHTLKSQLEFLRKEYSVQAEPRNINLFEYKNGERIRIDRVDDTLIENLKSHPENFSPNVILRPLMQQSVLPSIANIGGGAEVSYWLQIKPIFESAKINFPALILRDIFSPLEKKSIDKWTENKLELMDFFLSIDELKKKIALQNSNLESDFKNIEIAILEKFKELENKLIPIDKSLVGSYQAEVIKLQKSIELLYSKALKAEKKKAEDLINSLEKIKNKVFEANYLTERKENFSTYYLRYGSRWIDNMIQNADPLKWEWKLDVL
ncbi:MAG: bacillithiol biosynthesis cysteine-adding enzyme BshC [Chitinophagales bacterium]|nr:bacillithiol biosynthesis cysteine-adding enzyme BshC [Chitinophagales bacterium]